MSEIVYLNGEFLPLDQARVSVLDRGFIFGDGVYEVIPVYSRRPFRLPEHLAAAAAQPRRDPARQSHDRRGMDAADPRSRRAPRRRGPVGLPAGHARRGEARSRLPEGGEADRVHDVEPPRDAGEGAGRQRRPLHHGDRLPLAEVRREIDIAARQLPAAAVRGRRRRGRSRPVPRRLPDRGLREQRLRRQERRAARAAEKPPDPARHHLRRRARAGGGDAASRSSCARVPSRKCGAPTRSG